MTSMKAEFTINHRKAVGSETAFTLIEMIGILAVIAILALVLVPVLVRQMDRIAGENESASLRGITDAFQKSVMRNRYIPGSSDWATNIAKELGVNISDVTINGRKQPRFFLIDHDLKIGGTVAGQSYQQATLGVQTRPVNVRFMVVSSIGMPLPNNMPSVPSGPDFNAIWDWNDASPIAPAASNLGSFTRGEDLKVQRVNLSPLFVGLWLTTYSSSDAALYSIDSSGLAGVVPALGTNGYLIQSSVLSLGFVNSGLTSLDSQQVLIRDNSFVFNENVWRGSITAGSFPGGLDIAGVVDRYLKAPANPRAQYGANQQSIVVSNMQAYMDAYVQWAGSYFQSPQYQNSAQQWQTRMFNSVQGQYLANSYDPPPGGVPCGP